MNETQTLSLGELKKCLAKLQERYQLDDQTPIFLDTGWDSLQEISHTDLSVEQIQHYQITDIISQEVFQGYQLAKEDDTIKQQAIIIRQNV